MPSSRESAHKFEAHITFKRKYSEDIKEFSLASKWSYSEITGDPLLGKEAWCYLTLSGPEYETLKQAMMAMCVNTTGFGFNPTRTKIEEILYDWVADVQ